MKLALAVGLAVLALSGCAHRKSARQVPAPPPAPQAAPQPSPAPEVAHTIPPATATAPTTTTPLYIETGLASWYGHPYHGRPAADGEIYDMEKMTAAHRTLPFDTLVRVVNLTNNKAVEVRITDRGPFVDGRVIDLSHAAARAIDMIGPGTAPVRMEILSLPQVPSLFAVQVGAFRDRNNAERQRARMAALYGSARLVRRDGDPALWRVLVGTEKSEDAAGALKSRIRQESGERNAFVVRLDS
ncbi:MAG TPA: septal ring lytic transglycosylase RlpA family protein [Bryobacteraceae bacterium]|nr:septal ring lytic transglycosylase RlpA family protein [Bryobacteraceae bacterium]